jgi:hypothetical protein
MKIVKISKETNYAYIFMFLFTAWWIYMVGDSSDYWVLLIFPFFYLLTILYVSYYIHKKRKSKYSFESYTIPKYSFNGFDKTKDNFAIMIPTKPFKPIRKWYQIFKNKTKQPSFQITDNQDGTKTWQLK